MNTRTKMILAVAVLGLSACQGAEVIDAELGNDGPGIQVAGKADRIQVDGLPQGFPAVQDLAVLYPLSTVNGVRGNVVTDSGRTLLPREWLENVSEAYAETEVGDALDAENRYEDWRVVSLRFVPCGPLGIRPDQDITRLCWPQVRLVWQPVLRDIRVFSVVYPFYADDRAIHTLYHVTPEGSESEPVLQQMREFLGQGGDPQRLDPAFLKEFLARRNAAITRLISGVAKLRTSVVPGAFDDLEIRAELNTNDTEAAGQFDQRLSGLLGSLCEPEQLFELTSFSLPEGRSPALLNIWVFVAFDGIGGEIVQKPIEVIGRDSGQVIGHAGMSESAGMVVTPDPELLEDLENPEFAAELEDSVAFEREDLERLDPIINDPKKTLVPNTVCSGCHSYNPIRFDFHALSHLETRDMTIAPRVTADIANDLSWLRDALDR